MRSPVFAQHSSSHVCERDLTCDGSTTYTMHFDHVMTNTSFLAAGTSQILLFAFNNLFSCDKVLWSDGF